LWGKFNTVEVGRAGKGSFNNSGKTWKKRREKKGEVVDRVGFAQKTTKGLGFGGKIAEREEGLLGSTHQEGPARGGMGETSNLIGCPATENGGRRYLIVVRTVKKGNAHRNSAPKYLGGKGEGN